MNKFFYNVSVAIPLRQTFTYHSKQKIISGTRVAVKFGSRSKLGIVTEEIKITTIQTKAIHQVLDNEPIFSEVELKILAWASNYYHHPIGEVLGSFLPTNLRNIKTVMDDMDSVVKVDIENNPFQKNLTSQQTEAVKTLSELRGFAPTLLYGVTGSGKTEVYIRCIQEQLLQQKSVLLLAPEIALTPQLEQRVKDQFGPAVGMYHSKMTPAKRHKAWKQFRTGEINILIGTRSAAMMSAPKLGLIIIDEEHDASYKQHEGFKFSARDLAIKRAQMLKIPIILGSATPSLRTLRLVDEKKFGLIKLTKRITKQNPPKFSILDINETPLTSGLAPQSIEAIAATLKQQKQAMIFINRRGFAPQFICSSCAWRATCNSCDSSLVLHHHLERLICHRCDSAFGVPSDCPSCGAEQLAIVGTGTEQLEITLQELFPQISIFRMDKDSTKKANSMELLLKAIHESKSSILIGTQMLIKGHDFPNLELVVAIDVDQGVTSLHPAAIEEMGQQLIQVAGRAGRSDGNALVLVQSRYAQDKNLLQLKKGNYLNFAKSILAERKALNQPPYSFEAIIKAASPKTQTNIDFLDQLKKTIDTKRCIAVGPIPAMQAKVRGSYQHHLVLQAPTRTDLNSLLQDLINQLSRNKSSNKVRWSVDVDPVEF
ncbi:primosomal protein N' [Gammaproteobacteria bacterium]|nr:primosomal protein N' [Gammaproteobacteria bacterium]